MANVSEELLEDCRWPRHGRRAAVRFRVCFGKPQGKPEPPPQPAPPSNVPPKPPPAARDDFDNFG